MTTLADKVLALHRALDDHGIAHAFGGALALAWCTQHARGTIDIDVNIFAEPNDVARVIAALPTGVQMTGAARALLEADGQVRVFWDTTPIDVFLNVTPFHDAAAGRRRFEMFGGVEVPFLDCRDLAVFKAFFNRTKDWADLEEMLGAGTLVVDDVAAVLVAYLGGDDERVERLRNLTPPRAEPPSAR